VRGFPPLSKLAFVVVQLKSWRRLAQTTVLIVSISQLIFPVLCQYNSHAFCHISPSRSGSRCSSRRQTYCSEDYVMARGIRAIEAK